MIPSKRVGSPFKLAFFRMILDMAAGFRLWRSCFKAWAVARKPSCPPHCNAQLWRAKTRIASERRPAKTFRNAIRAYPSDR